LSHYEGAATVGLCGSAVCSYIRGPLRLPRFMPGRQLEARAAEQSPSAIESVSDQLLQALDALGLTRSQIPMTKVTKHMTTVEAAATVGSDSR
jgi:hypothetical protein